MRLILTLQYRHVYLLSPQQLESIYIQRQVFEHCVLDGCVPGDHQRDSLHRQRHAVVILFLAVEVQ